MTAKEQLIEQIHEALCKEELDDWDGGWNMALFHVLDLLGEEVPKWENYN